MEFGLQEALMGIGILVIAGILFDGFRRMNRSGQGSLNMRQDHDVDSDAEDSWDLLKSELPNGGARVVENGRQDPQIDELDLSMSALRDDAPLTDSREVHQKIIEAEAFSDPEETAKRTFKDDDFFAEDAELERVKAEQEARLAAHYSGDKSTKKQAAQPSKSTQNTSSQTSKQSQPDKAEDSLDLGVADISDVIIINIMAKPESEILGPALFRTLQSCGLHHGDMKVYHRFEQHNGRGQLLFSAANVVEPGTFDPDQAEAFSTPGICLFMKLPGPKRVSQAFDLMLDCSRKLSKMLDADVKDENHSVMTQQTFEHYRQRVLEFERRQLFQKAPTQKAPMR